MYIEVGQLHIERAEEARAAGVHPDRGNPLAHALLQRVSGDEAFTTAGGSGIAWVATATQEYTAPLSRRAKAFVRAWTRGRPVQPARFRLRLEPALYRLRLA